MLFWSLRNPEHPEKVLRTPYPVCSIRNSPSMLTCLNIAIALVIMFIASYMNQPKDLLLLILGHPLFLITPSLELKCISVCLNILFLLMSLHFLR